MISPIHHDLTSAALALVGNRRGRDGAETRPSVLPKVIPRRPAPTIIGIVEAQRRATPAG
jgi:hypothetical protein